jgi:hypothetical protein
VTTFQVQEDIDEVKEYSEEKLRKKLRSNDLSGLELAREKGESEWRPLYEQPLFLEEVPGTGDPKDIARRRVASGFAWHLIIFMAVISAFTVFSGAFPFWSAFWGIGLFFHGAKAAKPIIGLAQEGKLFGEPAKAAAQLPAQTAQQRASDGLDEEAARIKELLDERGGESAASLSEDVDVLVSQVRDLIAHEADLDQQTSEEERAALAAELEEAEGNLERAGDGDRALFATQVETLRARRQTMDDAVAAQARLLARKSVAINQLKQLRLDLSRARAGSVELGDLGERVADMRIQVEADRETEEVLSRSPQLPPPARPEAEQERAEHAEEEEVAAR